MIESTPSGTVITGEHIELFRLLSIRGAVKLECSGMRLSRGRSALSMAKAITGLKTNDRMKQIAALENMAEDRFGPLGHRYTVR